VLNDLARGHLRKQGVKAEVVEALQTHSFETGDGFAYLDPLGITQEQRSQGLPSRPSTGK
jgi:hypothetical protein